MHIRESHLVSGAAIGNHLSREYKKGRIKIEHIFDTLPNASASNNLWVAFEKYNDFKTKYDLIFCPMNTSLAEFNCAKVNSSIISKGPPSLLLSNKVSHFYLLSL